MAAVEEAATDVEKKQEPVSEGVRPQFAEMGEEPSYTPLPRDYSSEYGGGPRFSAALEEHRVQPATALFAGPDEAVLRELDTPTFLRRFQF